MRLVRNCTPALAFARSPSSLNFTFSSKSPNVFVVQRNSLRGTTFSSEPPTMLPSSTRQVFFVSPSHPVNVLPSNSDFDSPRQSGGRQKARSSVKGIVRRMRSLLRGRGGRFAEGEYTAQASGGCQPPGVDRPG